MHFAERERKKKPLPLLDGARQRCGRDEPGAMEFFYHVGWSAMILLYEFPVERGRRSRRLLTAFHRINHQAFVDHPFFLGTVFIISTLVPSLTPSFLLTLLLKSTTEQNYVD